MPLPFPKTLALLRSGIDAGLHLGAQLYVSHHGQPLIDTALGHSRDGVPMSVDTVNLWMSSTKPVVAVALAQLWERGFFQLDDRVATHIPEFAARGKEAITIRHVLTHTAGFRAVVGLRSNDPFEVAVEKVCAAPLEPHWIPGRMAGYTPTASWFIVGELIRRLDGRSVNQYLREALFLPLGMDDCYVGMTGNEYRDYGNRMGFMYDTSGETRRESPHSNAVEDAAAVRPSGNGRGPIAQLTRFYEMLLNHGRTQSGVKLISPQTVDSMVARQRVGLLDQTFKTLIDWGLGFYINSNHYGADTPYGYGPHAGPRTFGHSGNQSSCAFCDPEAGLVVAWLCNGMPGEAKHRARQLALNTAIYEDIGAAG